MKQKVKTMCYDLSNQISSGKSQGSYTSVINKQIEKFISD